MTALDRVTEQVNRLGRPDAPSTPLPLLTVPEFFDGNNHVGCIGCNLEGAPAPAVFFELFRSFIARADVRHIRVGGGVIRIIGAGYWRRDKKGL